MAVNIRSTVWWKFTDVLEEYSGSQSEMHTVKSGVEKVVGI
jgi:hypothetical protein